MTCFSSRIALSWWECEESYFFWFRYINIYIYILYLITYALTGESKGTILIFLHSFQNQGCWERIDGNCRIVPLHYKKGSPSCNKVAKELAFRRTCQTDQFSKEKPKISLSLSLTTISIIITWTNTAIPIEITSTVAKKFCP